MMHRQIQSIGPNAQCLGWSWPSVRNRIIWRYEHQFGPGIWKICGGGGGGGVGGVGEGLLSDDVQSNLY